ncbi:NAD-dependent epimerase/dehydratase family protein [Albimonas sp. CAU 1670]|uniref:NAD-dependent epimerase/dehydratase family protein n=1 Tax=Albimonas sp. CAU 1670 TaxID=3032599 RepID=UPI0023DA118D|nr:NAD-dependent epimerase/dehydratase family protein [Albimonas sp. CAU 1670]MDF2232875.1 NAD-dependent epimerase/dehydratase family protein [Albimonas sp. CAU 1670]
MADWRDRIDAPVVLTGAAGFIGAALAEALLDAGVEVHGLDALVPYYDPALKQARLARLEGRPGFSFRAVDLADRAGLAAALDAAVGERPAYVVNLAAQAGVRWSIENPHAYGEANLAGFLNLLEECRRRPVKHLVYASSSSVYGGNRKVPFSERDGVDHPVSLYAATKKANELMAHAYADLYDLPATGLRFFTVYGPWGRPDMAYWKFAAAILEGRPIQVFNHGDMQRDFTYIDDIVEGVARLIPHVAAPDPDFDATAPTPATSWAPHRIYNIGARRPERLMDMIAILERLAGREAIKEFLPMQPGDVPATWADVSALERAVGFAPKVTLEEGLTRFMDWFQGWNGARG